MEIGNQYSYLFIGAGVTLGAVLLLRLLHARWAIAGIVALVIIILFAAEWLILRPGASDVDSLDAADAILNNGNPTFVEFFSNYCAGCIAARPVVDTLVADLQTRHGDAYNVLRVDIHTTFGRVLRERYGFSYTPEFVLFDGGGEEVWRDHLPPSQNDIEIAVLSEDASTPP